MDFKNKSDTSNNMVNWNHLTSIQKVSEQHTGKEHEGTTEKRPYWALYTYFGEY